MTQGPSEPVTPRPVRPRSFAALAAAALLGGGAALGGAAAIGAFDGGTTTVVERVEPASAAPASRGGLSPAEIYERSAAGVVQIDTRGLGGGGQGSGFVIDTKGHIVTNYHVIRGAAEIRVSFSNRDTLEARLVGQDPATDLALLQVSGDAGSFTPLRLGDSDRVRVGDPVVAIGNPFGLERTLTAGVVSALQRAVSSPDRDRTIDEVIQIDAPINQGNSGGPLFGSTGEVIGVNSQIETGGTGGGNVGIGFAVPSNTVKRVVDQLLETGTVEHAFLGVAARSVTPALAANADLPVERGLLIERVTEGSGADKAGLRAGNEQVLVDGESYVVGGDIIVAAAGEPISDIQRLRTLIGDRRPGDKLDLTIYRGTEKKVVTVTLGRAPT